MQTRLSSRHVFACAHLSEWMTAAHLMGGAAQRQAKGAPFGRKTEDEVFAGSTPSNERVGGIPPIF